MYKLVNDVHFKLRSDTLLLYKNTPDVGERKQLRAVWISYMNKRKTELFHKTSNIINNTHKLKRHKTKRNEREEALSMTRKYIFKKLTK